MARPKKQRPEDPLAPVREGNTPRLPPLSAATVRNAPLPAATMLANGIKRLERIEREIRELNRCKSDVYKELRDEGLDVGHVRRALRERRLDPLARAKREELFSVYWDQLNAALDAAEGDGGGE